MKIHHWVKQNTSLLSMKISNVLLASQKSPEQNTSIAQLRSLDDTQIFIILLQFSVI